MLITDGMVNDPQKCPQCGPPRSGWRRADAFKATALVIADPFPGEAAMAAGGEGAVLTPPTPCWRT